MHEDLHKKIEPEMQVHLNNKREENISPDQFNHLNTLQESIREIVHLASLPDNSN